MQSKNRNRILVALVIVVALAANVHGGLWKTIKRGFFHTNTTPTAINVYEDIVIQSQAFPRENEEIWYEPSEIATKEIKVLTGTTYGENSGSFLFGVRV